MSRRPCLSLREQLHRLQSAAELQSAEHAKQRPRGLGSQSEDFSIGHRRPTAIRINGHNSEVSRD
jgi:hypothetical protein